MSQLFFGNLPSVLTTVLGAGLLAYIAFVLIWNRQISKWGAKVFFLSFWGLAVCAFAAFRDDFYLSLQFLTGDSIFNGRFPADSLVSQLGSIGGAFACLFTISCLFIRRQGYRKAVFFIIAVLIIAKMVLVEYARYLML